MRRAGSLIVTLALLAGSAVILANADTARADRKRTSFSINIYRGQAYDRYYNDYAPRYYAPRYYPRTQYYGRPYAYSYYPRPYYYAPRSYYVVPRPYYAEPRVVYYDRHHKHRHDDDCDD